MIASPVFEGDSSVGSSLLRTDRDENRRRLRRNRDKGRTSVRTLWSYCHGSMTIAPLNHPRTSRSYGTALKLTSVAGSVPDAQPWPPPVRGTMVLSSILVRSTTAKEVAPAFASSAMAWFGAFGL